MLHALEAQADIMLNPGANTSMQDPTVAYGKYGGTG